MTVVTILMFLLFMPEASQRQPDFSGHWVLVEALNAGPMRGSSEATAPRPTSVTTTSGSAFNCGRECTITHAGRTLTVANARLAGFAGKDPSQATPSVTFQIDGQRMSVVDSFSPRRQLPVTAKWNGDSLEIVTGDERLIRTQTLSLAGANLVVVSITSNSSERISELRFKYAKKPSKL